MWICELAQICVFLSLGCQGISSATVDIIVTLGSYRAPFHFLNSLRTCMKSFFLRRSENVDVSQ